MSRWAILKVNYRRLSSALCDKRKKGREVERKREVGEKAIKNLSCAGHRTSNALSHFTIATTLLHEDYGLHIINRLGELEEHTQLSHERDKK